MSTYYRAALTGQAEGQQIVNVLYFGRRDGTPVEESIAAYDGVADIIDLDIVPFLQPCLPPEYEAGSISLSIVNSKNEVQSAFPYEIETDWTGTSNGTPAGTGQCAILAMRCVPLLAAQIDRVPKGSYLCIGPISSAYIGPAGDLQGGITPLLQALGTAVADASGIVGDDAYEVTSVRVGRQGLDGRGAVGEVIASFPRPNASDRNSRRRRPTGQ